MLGLLVAKALPALAAHLELHRVVLEAHTYGWLLKLFVDALPLETTLRVWDNFFYAAEEGAAGQLMLYRVPLAMLKLSEPAILKADDSLAVERLLKALPGQVRRSAFHRLSAALSLPFTVLLLPSSTTARG